MKIPVAKPYLGKDEAQSAYDTILTNWVTQGPRVQEFEEKFAAYVQSKYAVAVSNCTTALHLAMIVTGIKEGDEVICPSMSYIATANSIRYVGAKPIFAEVGIDYNLDLIDTENKITPKTKAILLVHQIGMPANIEGFIKLCEEKQLLLIEDAACAVGSEYKGAKIGSHSSIVCFSFHPRKVITTGDGGMITTNRKDFHDRFKLLRQHGMSINDRVRHESNVVVFEDHLELGYNYRMTDIQAAVGIKQLEKLNFFVDERRKIAALYQEAFKDIPFLRLPTDNHLTKSNFQSFSIYLKLECPISRNDFMQKMLDAGISTRRGIMTAHRETAYKYLSNVHLPISEDLSDRSVIIPLYYPMTESEISFVIEKIKSVLS